MSEIVLALVAGFLVAALGTPVGVSGAVFLLPLQASVLGVSGPAISATNLVFNALSTPLALLRAPAFRGRAAELLVVAGACVPAAVAGAYGRVTLFADPARFRLLVIAVLAPLGVQLLLRAVRGARAREGDSPPVRALPLAVLALVTGAIGGTIGIGGGSMLAPVLVAAAHQSVARAAPLAFTSTLSTSLSGLAAYSLFDAFHVGTPPAAPVWHIGIATGLGGVAGALLGAAVARRAGERVLTLLLGTTATVTAATYVIQLV